MSFRIIQQGSVALVDDMNVTEQNWWLRAIVLGDAYGAITLKAWGVPKGPLEKLVSAGHVTTDGTWAWITKFDLTQTDRSLKGRPARCSPEPPAIDDPRCSTCGNGTFGAAICGVCVRAAADAKMDPATAHITDVFEHWAALEESTGGIKGAKLTVGRRSRILARLKDGYTVDDLKLCIDGYLADDFYLGKNDRKTRFTSLDTILLNGDRVERGKSKGRTLADRHKTADHFSAYDRVGS